jgi:hypothetical protein
MHRASLVRTGRVARGWIRISALILISGACQDSAYVSQPSVARLLSSDGQEESRKYPTGDGDRGTLLDWRGIPLATGNPPPSEQCPNLRADPSASGASLRGAILSAVECQSAPGCSPYNSWAPPLVYGDWLEIQAHIGDIWFTVYSAPTGETTLFSQVHYWASTGWQTTTFFGQTSFKTGNAVANISVRFYGTPSGTAVCGRICW